MEVLIEELTKVNPANLSKDGLKLFNKINEIIDRNEELKYKYNKALSDLVQAEHKNKELEEFKKQVTEIENTNFIKYKNYIPVSLVEETIEELKEEIEQLRIEKNVTYDSGIYRNRIKLETLQELLEKR